MPHPTRRAPYIGKYRLGREIGAGGSATVHLAFDAQLGRWVALKVLHERFIRQPIRVADFLTQAHHTARLDHPNVVAVLDIDTRARRPWIAMEFLSGRSLAATLRARRTPGRAAAQPFELAEALRMVRDVAAGLAHAHRHSVIHYDVSPGNVMQAPCGGLTLIDFGLPPLRRHRQGSAAAIRGTTHFMAPEQVVDDPGTPATDVYAAGCLLYALVTGVPPFLGPDAGSVMRSHLNDTPQSAREHQPDLPVWIDDLFGTLLAKQPTDRPLDGTALYNTLDEASRKLAPDGLPGCGAHAAPNMNRETAAAYRLPRPKTESEPIRRIVTPTQIQAQTRNNTSAINSPEPSDHQDTFSEPDLVTVAGAPVPEVHQSSNHPASVRPDPQALVTAPTDHPSSQPDSPQTARPQPDSPQPVTEDTEPRAVKRTEASTPTSQRAQNDQRPDPIDSTTRQPKISERRAARAARLASERPHDSGQPDINLATVQSVPVTTEVDTTTRPRPATAQTGPGSASITTTTTRTGRPNPAPHNPAGAPVSGQLKVKAPKGRPTIVPEIEVEVEAVRVVSKLSSNSTPAA